MVIDKLSNSALYAGLHRNLGKAFEFIAQSEGKDLPEGRYAIDGDDVYAMVQCYITESEADRKWESHLCYIDVQCVLKGREAMLYAPVGALAESGAYLEDKDFQGYQEGSGTALRCEEGTFVIFWPQDIHKPCCQLDGPCGMVKIVVKIKV